MHRPAPPTWSSTASTLVPGYVDAHVHGGGGASFNTGTAEAAETVVAAHLAHGTTTIMASLVTDTTAELERSVRELATLAAAGTLAGIHLEGPWLSPKHVGAHDPALLTDPKPAEVDRLVEAADGHLRMVTLAPELTGGLDAVRRITAAGIVAAIGHTDASYDVARAALDAGAGAAPTCSTRCAGCTTASPDPAPRCSSTRTPTSS